MELVTGMADIRLEQPATYLLGAQCSAMNYSVSEVKDDNTEDSTRNITWIEDGFCWLEIG